LVCFPASWSARYLQPFASWGARAFFLGARVTTLTVCGAWTVWQHAPPLDAR
jgi:hypothetical protein